MKTLARIGIVVFLCGLALAGLALHNRSLMLTRQVAQDESRCKFLTEKRDSLEAEVLRLSSFARLESLWVAAGRPAYSPAEDVVAVQEPDTGPMILAQVDGQDIGSIR